MTHYVELTDEEKELLIQTIDQWMDHHDRDAETEKLLDLQALRLKILSEMEIPF